MDYCIGIDIGTTNLKVIAFDLSGNIITLASNPNPVYIEGKFHYFVPEKIWEIISSLIRKVSSEVRGKIISIAVASMAESVVPIGEDGEVLFPAIAWYDERTKEQLEWVLQLMDPQTIYSITGLRVLPIYS
ncbi:MAG: FGGY family carbohydrate kinase, partial [bacterium]|nr:FGGY family carbohydrate kinase [bacterium]